jgi:hypothetical protein
MPCIYGKSAVGSAAHDKYWYGNGLPGWNQTYGGGTDEAYAVVQTSDGGYALTGRTYSFGAGSADFYLVKTDVSGNMLWNKTYGGAGADEAHSVVQTTDGGYMLAGYTNSFGAGNSDFYLVKTDASGNLLWNRTYGGAGVDYGYSVVQTGDGGYAITGVTDVYGARHGDVCLIKTDSEGNTQWNKTYGGTNYEETQSLVQTGDGGYAVAGYTYSFGAGDANSYLVKTDALGNMQWNKTYGGTDYEFSYSLVRTSDGGYAIAGFTTSLGDVDCHLVKTDASGSMLWSKTYGGTGDDEAYSVVQTSDGGYALAGLTRSFGAGLDDCYLVKTDASGNLLWSRSHGGTQVDWAYSVVQTSDGGYALAGFTDSFRSGKRVCYLVKTDQLGLADLQWGITIAGITPDSITLYRGTIDPYYNFVRVVIWKIKQ